MQISGYAGHTRHVTEEERELWERMQSDDEPEPPVPGFVPLTEEELQQRLEQVMTMKVEPLPEDIERLGDVSKYLRDEGTG